MKNLLVGFILLLAAWFLLKPSKPKSDQIDEPAPASVTLSSTQEKKPKDKKPKKEMKKDQRWLEKRYQTSFRIDSEQGEAFTITANVKLPTVSDDAILEYLRDLSEVMQIDIDQLKHPERQLLGKGDCINYHQEVGGVPVEGALVRVFESEPGKIYMVNSSFDPEVKPDLNTTYTVPASEALDLVLKDAALRDGHNQTPQLSSPTLIIHHFRSGPDISWRIYADQSYDGVGAMYFVNAHDKTMERFETQRR